jgi:thiamine pyrophosphate-dependent acetolactate synthase large subunit-like protein
MAMTPIDACKAFQEVRGQAIVVCTMTSMNVLDILAPDQPLTLSSVPLMGGAAALGLGIALAQPDRKVIVLDGDSSLLMELGVLSTVVGPSPSNFYHFVFANRVQFNGNFALGLPGEGKADFAAHATAAGYRAASHWETTKDLSQLGDWLKQPGPRLVELEMEPSPSRLSADNPPAQTTDARFTRMGQEAAGIRRVFGFEAA